MERNIKTKFYEFNQNNSGGYFVEDLEKGVCGNIIIEAKNAEEAVYRHKTIGEGVSGFWDYCPCCGERWSDYVTDDDGTDEPTIYGIPVEEYIGGIFHKRTFVHYYDGTFEMFDHETV